MTTFGWSSVAASRASRTKRCASVGVVALEVEALEHDLPVERRLADQVDDGHPAPGEHPDDLVAADALSAQGTSRDTTFRLDALQAGD